MTCEMNNEDKSMVRLSDFIFEPAEILPLIEEYENEPLVSIEESIEPIISLVPHVKELVRIVKQRCQQPADNLLSDESASIMLYTVESSFYSTLNNTLRNHNRECLKPWYAYLRLFTFALSKLPTISSRTVYRGIKKDLEKDFVPGKRMIWWSFSSCTSSIDKMKEYLGEDGDRMILAIDCHSPKDISRHRFSSTIIDVLLSPLRQFQVITSFQSDNHFPIVCLQEIQSIHSSSSYIIRNRNYENEKLEDFLNDCEYHSNINLYDRQLNDDDMHIVAEIAIDRKKCSELWLEKNQITSIGASIIAHALKNNSTLKWLSISCNCVGDRGVKHLTTTLAHENSALTTLALHSIGMTDTAMKYLADMLKTNNTLMELTVSGNKISEEGRRLLTDVRREHNKTLRWLYF